ncbi:hypothetical protein X729_31645 [Mesorhizobium sp. L103C131B0]|nr:DUF3618 domain-containing protein [Mesorhizobium sp. L103C131B0]ESZ53542.1 hypothetical protein X729_31645 [Mesorhizobium sp. L103C131B0]
MKEKSAAELEREAEAARARVMETAESIRGKMTPGQLLDEFTGLFSGGESAAMLSNLRTRSETILCRSPWWAQVWPG